MSFSSFSIFSASGSVPITKPVPVPAPEWWDDSEEDEND